VPVFVGAIVVGSSYVYNWLAAGFASLAGFVMGVYFTHLYNFPICIF